MIYDDILYDVENDVATIVLNRPSARNALTTKMRAEILHALKLAVKESRAIVLMGAGESFCAGQDLGQATKIRDIDLEGTLRDEYEPILHMIYNAPVPTIAAVNGAAAGAGANLALAADIVVADESAKFIQAFTKIGLIPDAGGTYWLPRQVGFSRAMGAALLAEPIEAQRALQWGMIWDVVPDADLKPTVRKMAEQLAAGPTEAYRHVKKAIRLSFEQTLEEQLETEAHFQGKLGKTRDFVEGVMAFSEKRPAKFEGR